VTGLLIDTGDVYIILATLVAILAAYSTWGKSMVQTKLATEPLVGKVISVAHGDNVLYKCAVALLLIGIADATQVNTPLPGSLHLSPSTLRAGALVVSAWYVTVLSMLVGTPAKINPTWHRTVLATTRASWLTLAAVFILAWATGFWLDRILHGIWSVSLLVVTLVSIYFAALLFRVRKVMAKMRRTALWIIPWVLIPIGCAAFYEYSLRGDWLLYAFSVLSFICLVGCTLRVWSELISNTPSQ
jgi:hypothetical protein